MNLVAVVGSPRKGKATDTLIDRAIEGACSVTPGLEITKIYLAKQNIGYCQNCLACRDSKKPGPYARCKIRDDMDSINESLLDADLLIMGSPLHMASVTALMMTFLERICWTWAKPERKIMTLQNCPMPRDYKPRRSVTIITNGIVPPIYRRFCDVASPLIKQTLSDSLNAKTVGDLYAGDIEHRGVEHYLDKAFALGKKLV